MNFFTYITRKPGFVLVSLVTFVMITVVSSVMVLAGWNTKALILLFVWVMIFLVAYLYSYIQWVRYKVEKAKQSRRSNQYRNRI